jgi:hypothetical protein
VSSSLDGLIGLPRLAQDAALFATLILALTAFSLGARAYLARQAIADRATRTHRLAARLERAEPTIAGSFADLRERATGLSADAERALWSLPRFEVGVARAQAVLVGSRTRLDELTEAEGRAMRRAFRRIRGTLLFLGGASELRRKLRA